MCLQRIQTDIQTIVERLQLAKHPEGGWYRETYRSSDHFPESALPAGFQGSRPASTAIYYLLGSDDFSAFHRIKSDEVWHFYAGTSLVIHVIGKDHVYRNCLLGERLDLGEIYQVVIPKESWFAAEVKDQGYVLAGCTVSPGFDYSDFELADRHELTALYPEYQQLIERLTRL
jgi:predicted cupin superfamily sugar epimerase